MEGFKEKSINNLQAAITESKTQPLYRLIFGLGIRYVGETTAKTLAHAVEHLLDFKKYTEEQLQGLEDVGIKVASSIYRFFHDETNIQMLLKLQQTGILLKNDKPLVSASLGLSGISFLFTGTLQKLKRNDAEALVEKHGGKLSGSVSSKLNYLVVGEDAGSKLEKAKKIPSVKIISEEDFLKMLPE